MTRTNQVYELSRKQELVLQLDGQEIIIRLLPFNTHKAARLGITAGSDVAIVRAELLSRKETRDGKHA